MSKAAKKQKRELRDLVALRDSQIDLSDMPEVRDWSRAVVGKFYRPIKKSLTIRLDADVLAWLKAQGRAELQRKRVALTSCRPPFRIANRTISNRHLAIRNGCKPLETHDAGTF